MPLRYARLMLICRYAMPLRYMPCKMLDAATMICHADKDTLPEEADILPFLCVSPLSLFRQC